VPGAGVEGAGRRGGEGHPVGTLRGVAPWGERDAAPRARLGGPCPCPPRQPAAPLTWPGCVDGRQVVGAAVDGEGGGPVLALGGGPGGQQVHGSRGSVVQRLRRAHPEAVRWGAGARGVVQVVTWVGKGFGGLRDPPTPGPPAGTAAPTHRRWWGARTWGRGRRREP